MLVESLARQIKDARLFEETRLNSWGTSSSAACVDIARVYLESGEVETSLSWLLKIPEGETFHKIERDNLLVEIYKIQGDKGKLTELLFRKFTSYVSVETLQELLEVVGQDKRDEIIEEQVSRIRNRQQLKESDALFLFEVGKTQEAEDHVVAHAGQLNGSYYGTLIPLAEALESDHRYFAASLIYRSLLLSILDRAYAKAHHHGS